jgi:hypothetical protein
MNAYYIYFVIFAFILYLIVSDASFARLVVILSEFVRIQYERLKWYVLYNPQNPIVKYLIWRRSLKLAEELQRELAKKSKD